MNDIYDPIRHEAPVAELRAALADPKLLPTDVLIPNAVANLAIIRDNRFVGFVDLLNGHVGIEWSDV